MREIKFRAWLKPPFGEDQDGYEMVYDLAFEEYEPLNDQLKRVKTLMQYTGLKDKNGVEIYEGDVVEVKYKNYPKFKGKIFWEPRFLCYMVTSPHCVFNCMSLNEYETINAENLEGVFKYCERQYKVIGNIYEHAHLLEAISEPAT